MRLIGSGCGIQGQNYAVLVQGSGSGFHYKDLILVIYVLGLTV